MASFSSLSFLLTFFSLHIHSRPCNDPLLQSPYAKTNTRSQDDRSRRSKLNFAQPSLHLHKDTENCLDADESEITSLNMSQCYLNVMQIHWGTFKKQTVTVYSIFCIWCLWFQLWHHDFGAVYSAVEPSYCTWLLYIYTLCPLGRGVSHCCHRQLLSWLQGLITVGLFQRPLMAGIFSLPAKWNICAVGGDSRPRASSLCADSHFLSRAEWPTQHDRTLKHMHTPTHL